MDYKFLDNSIDKNSIILPISDKINQFLIKNHDKEIRQIIDFLDSKEKFLYMHGFVGTGKRQVANYICEFLNNDVIKLEYYCKPATVCDDILLSFTDAIESNAISKAISLNTKITTLGVKLQRQISSIKKPFLIILHSFDDIVEANMKAVVEFFEDFLKEENVKLIISTRAQILSIFDKVSEDRKVFLKALKPPVYKEFLESNQITASDKAFEDFYGCTRGYYYYVALTIKIIQAMKLDLGEFVQKYKQSGMTFDSFLGVTYINLMPTSIRNFFWFLKTMRHGLSLNALANFDIYDEFSIEYLKSNLMVFQVEEMLYVQDFFLQKLDFSIPEKTQIRLHKYIINIYEKQLKEPLKTRSIMVSRQAMRAEIEYHNECILSLEEESKSVNDSEKDKVIIEEAKASEKTVEERFAQINTLLAENKYTQAIESLLEILELENIDLQTVVDVRLKLAKAYQKIDEYQKSAHYFGLVETYYKQNKEYINLNYLYYDLSQLYDRMYKKERAIETIKEVIYSVNTPQSLLVSACTLLGNFYTEYNNPEEAYSYYKKALESLDDDVENEILAELYFKFALANDDRGEMSLAFEYYNKCLAVSVKSNYKDLARSNLASCYMETGNIDEALTCFLKSYQVEKDNNNYDGVYYTASHIAQIYVKKGSKKALDYLLDAKKSAEFINEEYYIIEASIALGDYYYNNPDCYRDGLKEYFRAKTLAMRNLSNSDLAKIERRIADMKLRMDKDDYLELERKYDKNQI